MKASDAKKFIGQDVRYKKQGWGGWRVGTVKEVKGRNIILDDDALWAPQITEMQLLDSGEAD